MSELILASGSATRAKLLTDAGLSFTVVRPSVDEEAIRDSLRAEGLSPRAQADALAEVKAVAVSRRTPGMVIGADQMLSLGTEAFDKPKSREEARAHLQRRRVQTHVLQTAAVVARDGEVVWRHIETPRLTMRPYTDDFIESYLDAVGDAAMASVGAYQLEGRGAQLFAKVEGDYYSILGLPLLPLLAFLREQGAAAR